MMLWILVIASLSALSSASPTVSFPINAQVPPIARIGQPFSFIFSPSTFSSSSNLSYSLDNPPTWLSIDGDARRLYGTPREADVAPGRVVGVQIGLVASDATGSTLLGATLVVSRDSSPTIQKPLSQQIAGLGQPFSAPSSILSYPDRDFSFSFAADTFSESGLNYYAVAGDNSPVPAWISFDPSRLSFSGRTPPLSSLVEPPETFAFQLVASDVTGFSAASLPFAIVVGNHELTVDETALVLNATIGAPVSYTRLRGLVKIDGKPADRGAVSSVSAQDMPSWLSLDENSWEISGSPPPDAKNTSFSVIFADATSDKTNVTIQLNISSRLLFRDALPDIKVRRGEHFLFDLKPHLWKASGVEATQNIHPDQAWVHFDADSLTWSGDVPDSLTDSSFTISIHAMLEGSSTGENQTIVVHVGAAALTPSTAAASSRATQPAATTSSSPRPIGPSVGTPSTNLVLIVCLVTAILLFLGITVVIFCHYRRRRKRLSRMLERKDISGPVAGSFVANGGGGDDDDDGAGSLRQLSKQFDVGPAAAAGGKKGQASSAPNSLLGRSRTNENSPPPLLVLPPPDTPASAPARLLLRSVHDSAPLSRESWRAGSTTTMLLSTTARSRTSRSKSYLSDTSLYDDDQATLDLLATSPLDSAFRGDAPINGRRVVGPASSSSSIQHTPDLAYAGPPRRNSRSSPDDSAVAGLPSSSRIANKRRSWAAARGGGTAARPPSSKPLRRKFSSSLSTIDTLDGGGNWMTEPSPGGNGGGGVIHRPRPAYYNNTNRPVAAAAAAASEKQPPPPPHPLPPPASRRHSGGGLARESWARRRATWRASREAEALRVVGRDSLGLSYEDIVARSPFHPSSAAAGAGGGGASWGTLAASRREAAGLSSPSPSNTTTGDEKNWTTVHDASSPSEAWSGDGDVSEMSTPEIREGRRVVVLGEVRRGGLRQETARLGGVGMAVSRWSKGRRKGGEDEENSNNNNINNNQEEGDDYRVYI